MTVWMSEGELRRQKKYGRTLMQVAKYIVKHPKLGLRAEVSQWTADTDTTVAGTRFRRPGKGRKGLRIRVWCGEFLVLDHKNSETYRRTAEVTDWLERWAGGERVDQHGHDNRHWKRTL